MIFSANNLLYFNFRAAWCVNENKIQLLQKKGLTQIKNVTKL